MDHFRMERNLVEIDQRRYYIRFNLIEEEDGKRRITQLLMDQEGRHQHMGMSIALMEGDHDLTLPLPIAHVKDPSHMYPCI